MLADYQTLFLRKAAQAAHKASLPFEAYAACEAGLESGFGHSALAVDDNNLFGMKQHKHPIYGTHVLPTKEFLDGKWVKVNALWVHYPDWAACFADRLATLERLAPYYPHYKAALEAPDGETYVRDVSLSWSTDPHRADKVLDIYRMWSEEEPRDVVHSDVEGLPTPTAAQAIASIPKPPTPDGLK